MQGRSCEQKRENLRYTGDNVDYIRRAGAWYSFEAIKERTGLTHKEIRMIYDKLFQEGKVL